MRVLLALVICAALAGCATNPLSNARFWKLEDCARLANPTVRFNRPDGAEMATIPRSACTAAASASEKIQTASGQRIQRFLIADLEDTNAFATRDKDGSPVVAVTLGMLKALGGDEDAWAGLLGHEVAHLVKRHGDSRQEAQTTARGAGEVVANILSAMVPGVGGAVAGTLGGTAAQWAVYGAYTRPQEAEADELGLQWMVASGYDPRGLTRLFAILAKSDSLPAFLSTHPAATERAEMVARYIASSPIQQKRQEAPTTIASSEMAGAIPAENCNDATSPIRLKTLCLTEAGCNHQSQAIVKFCANYLKAECTSARIQLPYACMRSSVGFNERNCDVAASAVSAHCAN